MDSPIVSQLFKQLFAHRPCASCAHHVASTRRLLSSTSSRRVQPRRKEKSTIESSWQQRTDHFPLDKLEDYKKYPMVTADQLRTRKERPRRVKMLMRDFIEGRSYIKTTKADRLNGDQTHYTIPRTAISRNKLSFSRRATRSTSPLCPTRRLSMKN